MQQLTASLARAWIAISTSTVATIIVNKFAAAVGTSTDCSCMGFTVSSAGTGTATGGIACTGSTFKPDY